MPTLDPSVSDIITGVIARLKDTPGALLPILHAIQDALGYVPPRAVPAVADGLNLSRAKVHGVISFYHYFRCRHPSEIMDEIARLTPTFACFSYEKLDRLGSIQWPWNDQAPEGTPTMHVNEFVRGKGKFFVTEFVPTNERATRRYHTDADDWPYAHAVQRRRSDAAHRQRRLGSCGRPRDPPARRRGPWYQTGRSCRCDQPFG
jgi:hypothetical protein